MCNADAQRSPVEIVARAESKVLHVLPSLVLGVLYGNIFITTVGAIYLPHGKELSGFRSELTLSSKAFVY